MSRRGSTFQNVPSLKVGRSVFDLSYEKKFDCDMGQLIPIMCDECVPGDIWKIGNEIVLRFQPLVAPILHSVHVYVHYFFVPYRLLWRDWEKFITGGVDGDFVAVPPRFSGNSSLFSKGSLADYFGFPLGVDLSGSPNTDEPLFFPWQAYNFIWNEFYRDENLQSALGPRPDYPEDPGYSGGAWYLGNVDGSFSVNNSVLRRAWTKDYFTSALPWQQRGTAPALPINGETSALFSPNSLYNLVVPLSGEFAHTNAPGAPTDTSIMMFQNSTGGPSQLPTLQSNSILMDGEGGDLGIEPRFLNDNVVDLSTASTFDINDLRVAFQIQKWLERNARSGARYTEFLRSHFPAFPRDDRLSRPEYIGGSKTPVIISEVLQTSATQSGVSAQGNMAGHGITVDKSFCASYHVQEFGLIMGLMSVMPRPAYQQGIDRQWLRRTKYDFYFPEFAHLGEQAIEEMEIYTQNSGATDPVSGVGNHSIFGYQGRYDELRVKRDMVCNNMRDILDYWHLGRQFSNAPLLNGDFIVCNPRKDIFAVQDEPGLLVNFGNIIKAIRPMPVQATPGLIDHF